MKGTFGASAGVPFAIILMTTVIFVATIFSGALSPPHLAGRSLGLRQADGAGDGAEGSQGARALSAAANVFMGQTEAPLIVKPYVAAMTQSELLAVMVGGMATISGGVMAVYIRWAPTRSAILATSVMAAPCGLYLAKILLPETGEPATRGQGEARRRAPARATSSMPPPTARRTG